MGAVALKLLPYPPTPDGYLYYDQITFGGGSPPGRPVPQPPLGIWGPTDPRPTHPIAGWNPGTGTFPPGGGSGGGGNLPEGTQMVAVRVAENQPVVPEGLPPDSKLMDVAWEGGGKGQAWGLPYAAPV